MPNESQTESGAGLIRLVDGLAEVVLVPKAGGAIAAYRWNAPAGPVDWLRPATPDAIRRADAGEMSCFPLVPYSNRVRDGRFRYRGVQVHLPVSVPDDPHFEHGHGWRNAWQVDAAAANEVTMRYVHEPDEWPWRYEATQRVSLRDGDLTIEVCLRNLSDQWMPAGFGLHPYFPSSPRSRIEAHVARMWETDAEVLPTKLVEPRAGADPNKGITVADVDLDNVFTDWSGTARISWPENGRALEIRAERPLGHLVLYTPPGEGHFCVEPVSNATDAFNLAGAGAAAGGVIELGPDMDVRAQAVLTPRLDAAPAAP